MKSTCTLEPALMLHVLANSIVRPVAAELPAPPTPAVPDCRQPGVEVTMLLGTEPRATELAMLNQLACAPDNAVGTVNETTKLSGVPVFSVAGVAVTALTGAEGFHGGPPMV